MEFETLMALFLDPKWIFTTSKSNFNCVPQNSSPKIETECESPPKSIKQGHFSSCIVYLSVFSDFIPRK